MEGNRIKPLKVGVIGCGLIAQEVHIPNYIENSMSELVAVCDVEKNAVQKVAEKYGIKHTFTDYRELLEQNLVEAVSVCTPTSTHSKIVIDAASHGVHTLCEKPLALTLAEADEMLDAVSPSKIKFMVGYNYRFLPNHIRAKQYVSGGRIGKPILIRGEVVTAGPYRSRMDKKHYQYETEKRLGAFFDIGSHLVDLFIWMMGNPKEVFAFFSTHKSGIKVDDSSVITIKFESGVLGNIVVSWLNLPDYQSMANNKQIEIIGEKGKIESDFFGPSLSLYSTNSLASKIKGKIKITPSAFDPKIPDEALRWSYKKEIDSFLRSIIKNREPPVTGKEAREALKLVLAAYESDKSKTVVVLK